MTKIAFQGVAGAHSDMAARKKFPEAETIPCKSFSDVIVLVEKGEADLAFIPIENSYAGRVAEIHNILPNIKLNIIGEYFHKVQHNLLGLKGSKISDVKEVYSHQQALMQCREFCHEYNFQAHQYYDTAAAAKMVSEWSDAKKAAISPKIAAKIYGLDILKENIQDADNNTTLFIILASDPAEIDFDEKKDDLILTSMIFTTRNISGGLYKSLGGFATNNVNLLKLESYIPNYKMGEAQFFITFAGHPEQDNVRAALEEFGFFTKNIKLLGVYEGDKGRVLN